MGVTAAPSLGPPGAAMTPAPIPATARQASAKRSRRRNRGVGQRKPNSGWTYWDAGTGTLHQAWPRSPALMEVHEMRRRSRLFPLRALHNFELTLTAVPVAPQECGE